MQIEDTNKKEQVVSEMPISEIMKLRDSEDEEKKMALLLAIHCAPILKGSKAANIMTVTMREFYRIGYLLQETGITYRFLKTKGEKGILYLYREKELAVYLHSKEIRSFLRGYGYRSDNLDQMLDQLSDRIMMYNHGETAFPHEIGVFLEYPLMDVKGFLENHGENFAYSGYWKVYDNVQDAVRKFRQYDEEREYAIKAIAAGKTIREIVVEANLR